MEEICRLNYSFTCKSAGKKQVSLKYQLRAYHMLMKTATNERMRLISGQMSEWTYSWPHVRPQALANHWQPSHNMQLTSALRLNASNQIIVLGAIIIRHPSNGNASSFQRTHLTNGMHSHFAFFAVFTSVWQTFRDSSSGSSLEITHLAIEFAFNHSLPRLNACSIISTVSLTDRWVILGVMR